MIAWFFNPILVRELRQAVRNRVILYGLQFYLLTLVFAFFYTIFVRSITTSNDMELGGTLFPILLNLTFYTTLLSVVVYGAGRLVFERVHDDLMFYSTIGPIGFVFGKMTCGFVISLMFYSVSFPFITLVYLLRGVEITTMLLATGYSFCTVQLILLLAIVFFAGADSWISAMLRLVAFLFCGGGLFGFSAMVLYSLVLTGQYDSNFQSFCFICLAQFLLLPILLFFLASCQFSPVEANRMWAFRVAATAILIPSFLICLFLTMSNSSIPGDWERIFTQWIVFTFYPFVFFCFLAMHERERYGFRMRRNIPRSFLGRLIAFPFYTGDYNALVWLTCWIVPVIVAVPICETAIHYFGYMSLKRLSPCFAAALLTYAYVSFTLYLWSRFLYRRVAKAWIGAITFSLLVAAFIGNYTIIYLTAGDIFLSQLLSPFFLLIPNYLCFMNVNYYDREWTVQLYFSLGVFVLFLGVNLRETVRMFRTFRRWDGETTENTLEPE